MTRDSIRDFRQAFDCAEYSQCYPEGLISTVGLLHGWLWMRLLVAAHLAGLTPLQEVTLLLLQNALAAGLVFLAVAPYGGRVLAAWTAAIFVTMCEATGFPEMTTAYVSFLPQAAFYLGLSRVVAGKGLGWSVLAGLGLWACVDLHVSSLALVPFLIAVPMTGSPPPARPVGAGVLAALIAGAFLSQLTWANNLAMRPAGTAVFLGGVVMAGVVGALTRPWWLKRPVEERLLLISVAFVLWWVGIEWMAGVVAGVPVTPWNPIPIVTPLAVVVAACCQIVLRRAGGPGALLLVAAPLAVAAWRQQDFPPLAPMWNLTEAALALVVLTSPGGPLARFLDGSAAQRSGARLPQLAAAAIYAIVVVRLASVSPHRIDWDYVEAPSVRAGQVLGTYLKSKGWSCADARLAEGRDILTGDSSHPFVCLMLDDEKRNSASLPRLLPAPPGNGPAPPGWEALDFGRGRRGLVSSITPWIVRTTGHGTLERDGTTIAAFDLHPFWEEPFVGHPEYAYRIDIPLALNHLIPGYERHHFDRATAIYDFPIQISGSDDAREVDVLGSDFPSSRWKVAEVEGVDHVIAASGYHVTLKRGASSTGRIRFIRASKDPEFSDVPVDLIETTPAETAIRAMLPDRSGWP